MNSNEYNLHADEYCRKIKDLEDRLAKAEKQLAMYRDPNRVVPYCSNTAAREAGFFLGAVVLIPWTLAGGGKKRAVVVAYDRDGNPLVQGPELGDSTEAYLVEDLELLLPPLE